MSDVTKRMLNIHESYYQVGELCGQPIYAQVGATGANVIGAAFRGMASRAKETDLARASEKADVDALKVLYEENADYIRLNNLGNAHHNASMREAARIVAEFEAGE